MSNFGDLTDKNKDFIDRFGGALGLLADISGTAGFVTGVMGLLSSSEDPLQALHDEFLKYLKDLGSLVDAGSIESTVMSLGIIIGKAKADFVTISHSPGPHDDPEQQLEDCLAPIESLTDPNLPVWQTPFLEANYWTDAGKYVFGNFHVDFGYGKQVPDQSGGLAFSYIYFLPVYLEALSIYTAVGLILFPDDFVKRFGDPVLKPNAAFLEKKHNDIMSAITPLVPALTEGIARLLLQPWDRDKLLGALGQFQTPPLAPLIVQFRGITPLQYPADFSKKEVLRTLGGVNIEYGAVEKFSGFSSMRTQFAPAQDYKLTWDEIMGMPDWNAAYAKFQIRLWKRVMDVYLGVGLLDVWKAINGLRAMVGDAPLPRPTLGGVPIADWSFRYLMSTAKIPPQTGSLSEGKLPIPGLHARDLAKFIESTPPNDTSPSGASTSFRSLLGTVFP